MTQHLLCRRRPEMDARPVRTDACPQRAVVEEQVVKNPRQLQPCADMGLLPSVPWTLVSDHLGTHSPASCGVSL